MGSMVGCDWYGRGEEDRLIVEIDGDGTSRDWTGRDDESQKLS